MEAGKRARLDAKSKLAIRDKELIPSPPPYRTITALGTESNTTSRLNAAVTYLERMSPELSARHGLTTPQKSVILTATLIVIVLALAAPQTAQIALEALFALSFALLLMIRLWAIAQVVAKPAPSATASNSSDQLATCSILPTYTILVALYHEAPVVGQLVAALAALDYPKDRLDIIIALETDDLETRVALERTHHPSIQIVIVPDGLPRTKPRALCYALTFARGEYVVVYDAEDQPEPDQLRKAVAAFVASGPKLGCLQAHLNVDNRRETWLTSQFTIEYTALFDAVLPTFAHAGLPVPLGGTSNHFPRAVLEFVGGWDPYNVTEDADLGLRLARFGWRVGILSSTTWEEAPPRWTDWLAQRTRWQKGWLQTYFVHMRHPRRLWQDLGWRSWLWLQVVLGGGLLSALVHPWFYAWIIWHGAVGTFGPPDGTIGTVVWWSAVANLIAAYLATIALSLLTLRTRGFQELYLAALASPLYWLPISHAAYCAVFEWIRAPHHWAKTPHRARARTKGQAQIDRKNRLAI